MTIGDRLAGDRLLASQKLSAGSPYLQGEEPPTANQVSAVLHALADHGLLSHMNSETVLALGDDRAYLGGTWRQDIAHGRFFQAMGDSIAEWHDPRERAQQKAEMAEMADPRTHRRDALPQHRRHRPERHRRDGGLRRARPQRNLTAA